jgi:hypothetical protein
MYTIACLLNIYFTREFFNINHINGLALREVIRPDDISPGKTFRTEDYVGTMTKKIQCKMLGLHNMPLNGNARK